MSKYYIVPTVYEGSIERIGAFDTIEDALSASARYVQESEWARREDWAGIFIEDEDYNIVMDNEAVGL